MWPSSMLYGVVSKQCEGSHKYYDSNYGCSSTWPMSVLFYLELRVVRNLTQLGFLGK